MEKMLESAQNGSEKAKKRRSEEEKVGRGRWIVRTLRRMEDRQKRIDRRTRMLAAGLRELFMLGEDYVSMVACQDEIDVAILSALREAGATTSALVVEPGQDNFDMVIGRDLSLFTKQDEDMNLQCKVHEVVAPRIKRPTSICEITGLT
jgi:hypothetical protein